MGESGKSLRSVWSLGGDHEFLVDKIDLPSRVVYHRLIEWKIFERIYGRKSVNRCKQCYAYGNRKRDVRITAVGTLCLGCWLDWPTCERCGVGAAQRGLGRGIGIICGERLCQDCLVPDIPDTEANLHQITLMYDSGSNYFGLLDLCLEEDDE